MNKPGLNPEKRLWAAAIGKAPAFPAAWYNFLDKIVRSALQINKIEKKRPLWWQTYYANVAGNEFGEPNFSAATAGVGRPASFT